MLKKILAILVMLYATVAFAAIDVNKASAAELDSVKGIGPAISGKIIDERKKGAFKDWQDFIDRVKGVGENNAAKFSAEGLTVNGASMKGAAATKKETKTEAKADAKAEKNSAKEDKKETKAAAKEEKKDAKATAKEKKEEAKAEKKEAKAAAKEEKKDAKVAASKPAANAASAAKAASAKK
jgi:competence protein ComEA